MSAAQGVTAEELVRALRRRKATLPAEIGTFVVLETCEVLLTRGPCAVSLSTVQITDEGLVRIEGALTVSEAESAHTLHAMLTSLLVAAGPAPAPALMRLVEEGPSGGEWTLAQMRDDLEASLVPLNRHASRRVLSRLVRETGWTDRRPSGSPPPTFRELDAELSSLLGVPDEPAVEEPAPPPPRRKDPDPTVREPVERVDVRDGDIRFVEEDEPARAKPAVIDADATDSMPALVGRPGQLRDLDGLDHAPQRGSSRGAVVGITLVVLALALVGVTLAMRPDALSKLSGEAGASSTAEAAQPKVVHEVPVGGDLVVRVPTERAQVLRFVGRGPLTVPNLPLGVAHEFVAIADGQAPTRVVVPKDAEWESTPEGPRYELAMQLGAPVTPTAPLDLGGTMLPQDVGRPSGGLGSVRIVTTPRGAKVYQVIGFAPETKVSDLPLDATQELLVYREGFAHVVRVIAPSDFVEQGDRKVADVRIELTPVKKR